MVAAERSLLQSNGHEVNVFARHSDSIRDRGLRGAVHGGLTTAWNPATIGGIRSAIAATNPDIVHVHNTFPLISNSVFSGARARPRVLTLHNYRLYCAAGIPIRDGNVCTICLDRKNPLPGLRYGCYRDSILATVPLAAGIALHRAINTWSRHVDAFIALSGFQRALMVEAGLPEDRVHVKPNFCQPTFQPKAWEERHPQVLFVGRLSDEKGIQTLVRAWRRWGSEAPELLIIGSGPLSRRLGEMAVGANVRLTGQLSREETLAAIAETRLLVLPSEAYETFGLTVCEAMAAGTPVAVSAIGPLPGLVQGGRAGLVFRAADSPSLLSTIRTAWGDPARLKELGWAGRRRYEKNYSPEANYSRLLEIYRAAILNHRAASKR